MSEKEVLKTLIGLGVIVPNDHFVLTSGLHSDTYINKDALYPQVDIINNFCHAIADHFCSNIHYNIEMVVAPAIGGIVLAVLTASWLAQRTRRKVLMAYAEKMNGEFVFRRGYRKLVEGKKVLVLDDVLTTGGSIKKVIELVRRSGSMVSGAAVLCNRGGVSLHSLGIRNVDLFALSNVQLNTWAEKDCPLCKAGIPINTELGKGREFLANKKE